MITLKEIIKSAAGLGENNAPRAAISLLSELVTLETGERKQLGSLTLSKPELCISRCCGFVQIDIRFKSHLDQDLNRIRLLLKQYREYMDSYYNDPSTAPVFTLVMVPIEFDGRYYLQATNPVASFFNCSNPRDNEINTVTVLYNLCDFSAHTDEPIDTEGELNEMTREEESRRFLEEKAIEKREAELEHMIDSEDKLQDYYFSQLTAPSWDTEDEEENDENKD